MLSLSRGPPAALVARSSAAPVFVPDRPTCFVAKCIPCLPCARRPATRVWIASSIVTPAPFQPAPALSPPPWPARSPQNPACAVCVLPPSASSLSPHNHPTILPYFIAASFNSRSHIAMNQAREHAAVRSALRPPRQPAVLEASPWLATSAAFPCTASTGTPLPAPATAFGAPRPPVQKCRH